MSNTLSTHNPCQMNALVQRRYAAINGAAEEQNTQHNAQYTGYAYDHTLAEHNQRIGARSDC